MRWIGVALLLWGMLGGLAGAEGRIPPNATVRGAMWLEMLNPGDVGWPQPSHCWLESGRVVMAAERSVTHYTVFVVNVPAPDTALQCPSGTQVALPRVVYEDLLHEPGEPTVPKTMGTHCVPGAVFAFGASCVCNEEGDGWICGAARARAEIPAITLNADGRIVGVGGVTERAPAQEPGILSILATVLGVTFCLIALYTVYERKRLWAIWFGQPDDDLARMDRMIRDLGRMRETVDAVLGASVHRPGPPSLQDMTETFLRANRAAVAQRKARRRGK